MKTLISLVLVIFSFLGIFDASFLTYEKVTHHIPPCSVGFSCDTVLQSHWATIGPVPLSAFGVIFYTCVFILAVLNFLEISDIRGMGMILPIQHILMVFTTGGIFFSASLVFLMGFVIKAWCLYCLFSAVCCASLFFFSAWQVSRKKRVPSSEMRV